MISFWMMTSCHEHSFRVTGSSYGEPCCRWIPGTNAQQWKSFESISRISWTSSSTNHVMANEMRPYMPMRHEHISMAWIGFEYFRFLKRFQHHTVLTFIATKQHPVKHKQSVPDRLYTYTMIYWQSVSENMSMDHETGMNGLLGMNHKWLAK